jgi:GH24 family phage-related lysozyme (muramidase)
MLGTQLQRIVLSIQLPAETIAAYVRALPVECEILGLGKILLFYSERNLLKNHFDALVSFGFNCGTGVYVISDVCKALNQGKYEEVPQRLLAWSKAKINGVLQVNQGLYNRRKSEGELFSKKIETSTPVPQPVVESTTTWTVEILKEAQTCLKKLGLYTLKIDGLWGPGTSAALIKFAKDNNVVLGSNPSRMIISSSLEKLRSLVE